MRTPARQYLPAARGVPAVFLDKDGTLVEDVPYNVDPAKIRIYPEVSSALVELRRRGYKLLVVSNQPGIAQGYFDCEAVERAGEALISMLATAGAKVDGFYYCPHLPGAEKVEYSARCSCRKPRPGLLYAAAKEHDIDLERSWMVGDILNDVEAGKRAGCRTVLVDRGNETEWISGRFRKPDIVLRSLEGLPEYIRQDYLSKISGTN